MDWKLGVGAQEFQYRGEKKSGRWRFGDPIRLTLRWAKNSPEVPVPVIGYAGFRADDRKTEWEYNSRWSLLHFLRRHAAVPGDFAQMADPKPHTLKFVVETTREGVEDKKEGRSECRVFIRFIPAVPDGKGKEFLVMPSHFPETAPHLDMRPGRLKEE